MKTTSKSLLLIVALFLFANCPAQTQSQTQPRSKQMRFDEEPSLPVVQLDFNYTFHQPFGLLNERFSVFNAIGAGASYRWENRLMVGFNFSTLWGGGVKENGTLDSMTGPSGGLIDNNGNIAIVKLFILGYHTNAFAGYLFPTSNKNPNSGFLFRTGVGFFQHKIRHQYTINIMPQLEKDLDHGYDRLTNGVIFTQFLGYQYSSVLKKVHFWGGVELTNGFTKNRRGFNYDTRQYDNKTRNDNLISFKVGFMIPIFQYGRGEKEGKEIYFD